MKNKKAEAIEHIRHRMRGVWGHFLQAISLIKSAARWYFFLWKLRFEEVFRK